MSHTVNKIRSSYFPFQYLRPCFIGTIEFYVQEPFEIGNNTCERSRLSIFIEESSNTFQSGQNFH